MQPVKKRDKENRTTTTSKHLEIYISQKIHFWNIFSKLFIKKCFLLYFLFIKKNTQKKGKKFVRDEMGEVRPDPDIDVETQKPGENCEFP